MSAKLKPKLELVTKYPVVRDTVRPFRLWNPQERLQIPRRFYSDARRAQNKALEIARWDLKIGQSLEVVDVSTGKWLGVYTRRVSWIDFSN